MAENGVHPFGKAMLPHFNFEKGWKNLNHGSFGTFPTSVRETLRAYQDEHEAAPDRFLRYKQPLLINACRRLLSQVLHTSHVNLVLVPNATTGINTFIRNLTYTENSTITYFNTIYGSCEKMLLSLAETEPVTIVRLQVPEVEQATNDSFVNMLRDSITEQRSRGLDPKAVIFDTITSMPALRLPYEKLTALCKALGVLSIIDAAHGIGHIPFNLGELDPDFFVSNAHKWLYVPRGCGVMYVPERNQRLIRTTYPTSHGFAPMSKDGLLVNNPLPNVSDDPDDNTYYVRNFAFVGTLDTSAYLCIPAALEFRKNVCGGEEAIMAYCASLANKAQKVVTDILGTTILDNSAGTFTAGSSMFQAKLPLNLTGSEAIPMNEHHSPKTVCQWLEKVQCDEYNTLIPIIWYQKCWWARFSAQIYLELEDFEWGAKVLKDLSDRVKRGDHLC